MKFIIHSPALNYQVGGIIVLHQLAKDLHDLGHQVSLYVQDGIQYDNPFCSHFAHLDDVDQETVVIYPEVVAGNPLKAKRVVRWMLCDLGIHAPPDIYTTWGPGDLVFHFSTFNSQYDPKDVELLYTLWIDPKIQNNQRKRSGSCYLFRKASSFHRKIDLIHPSDALMIDGLNNEEIIRIFNEKEYFYNYDPHSYYDAMATLCGCVPIIYPLAGVSKLDWLKSKASFQSMIGKKNDMAGVAYGIEEIPYAKATIHLARQEQLEAAAYGMKTVSRFSSLVQDYFFESRSDHPFKNVESIAAVLQWNQQKPEGRRERDFEWKIKRLESELAQSRAEVRAMQSSKFWKMRDWYHGVKRSLKWR